MAVPRRAAMGPKLADMARVLDLTHEPGTGAVRRRRPVYVDLLPCSEACPAGENVQAGEPSRLGRRVVVYGGGDTAMDAARTARRLGADEALVVYRRDQAHMPAHPAETAEALSEGVKVRWLRTITGITGDELTVEEMVLDEQGWPQPTGRTETLRSDALVLALGQDTDSAFLHRVEGVDCRSEGTVVVGPDMMDRPPGDLRRRRHGADRTDGDGGRRPRQAGRPPHRRLAGGAPFRTGTQAPRNPLRPVAPARLQRRRTGTQPGLDPERRARLPISRSSPSCSVTGCWWPTPSGAPPSTAATSR